MDIKPLLAYNTWLALPQETRHKLEKLFDIPRTGEVIVRVGGMTSAGNIGGVATNDGHSAGDLYAISVEKMQEITGSDSDNFYALFKEVVESLDPVSEAAIDNFIPEAPKKKGGRPAGSKNKTDGQKTA